MSLELMDVTEVAEFLKISEKTIYCYTYNSGVNGGAKRKSFPKSIYIKLGKKVLFNKERLMDWLENGAELI